MTSPIPALPLVSVVTPSLNRAEFLEGVIRSVRAQTYPNIEHVVVDGGSTDTTRSILQRAEGSDGLRWISEPDDGVYDAVNKGMALCSGDILCYLNTDDRFFDHSVQVVVNAFSGNPGADLIFGDLLAFDEAAQRGWINFYPANIRSHLRRGGLVSQPTVFWTRAAAQRIGTFDIGLRLAADIDYWQRMLRHGTAVKVDEVLAYEGHHNERLTSGAAAAEQAGVELAAIRLRLHGRELTLMDRVIDKLILAITHRIATLRFLLSSLLRSSGWQNFRSQRRFLVDRWAMLLSLVPVFGRAARHRVVTLSPVNKSGPR